MSSFNKCILMGNLTRDPETKFSTAGMAICKFAIAMNHTFTKNGEKKETVTFVDLTAFGRTGEAIAQYLRKGQPIPVEGKLNSESWEKDGKKHSKLAVIVDSFQFIGSKRDSAPGTESAASTEAPAVDDGTLDVPF